jgi:hypothetical protein
MKKLAVLLLLGWLVGLPACSKKAPTAPPVITGTLQVITDPPGAVLFLNNEEKGVTPLRVTGIAIGRHELILSKFYFITWSETIAVTGPETVTKSYRMYPWGTTDIWGRDRNGWRQDVLFYTPVDSVWSSCFFSVTARNGDTLKTEAWFNDTMVKADTLVTPQGAAGRLYRWYNLSPGTYSNKFYWKYPGTSIWLLIGIEMKFRVSTK